MRRCEGEEEAHEALGLQLGADTYFAAGESGRAALLSCGSVVRARDSPSVVVHTQEFFNAT